MPLNLSYLTEWTTKSSSDTGESEVQAKSAVTFLPTLVPSGRMSSMLPDRLGLIRISRNWVLSSPTCHISSMVTSSSLSQEPLISTSLRRPERTNFWERPFKMRLESSQSSESIAMSGLLWHP